MVRDKGRIIQGYNAQAAATMDQVVVAAELTQQANDVQQLAPMLTAIRTALIRAGIADPLQRVAADCGYWSIACQAEWQLLCGTHNLLKLWRTTTAA